MANAINQFVRGRNVSLGALRETRETLEPALARLAAEHRTDRDLEGLKLLHDDLVAAVDDFQEFSRVNISWHNAVARASGNELLAAFLYSVSYGVAVATTTAEDDTMDTRKEVIRIHSRINEAIEARNPDLAERRMRQHIVATHARASAPETTHIPLSR